MPFKKGNKLAKGGAREGSGHPSDWLRSYCQDAIKKHKLFNFLVEVAKGEYTHYEFDSKGKKRAMKRCAEVKDRMKALEMISDRGFGKPVQDIELKGESASGNLIVVVPKVST